MVVHKPADTVRAVSMSGFSPVPGKNRHGSCGSRAAMSGVGDLQQDEEALS